MKKADKAARLLKEYSKKLGRPPEDIVLIGIIFCFSQADLQKKLPPPSVGTPAALIPL